MSDMWLGASEAVRVGPRTVAPVASFVPWGSRADAAPPATAPDAFGDDFADGFMSGDAMPADDLSPSPLAPVIDPEAIALDGFARGFEEGRRTLEVQLADERASLRCLAAAMEAAQPQPPAALATLIGETVGFLVRQIVGEAAVDPALLARRAHAAAALVTDEAKPARMRLHPDDVARLAGATLPLALVADPALSPGSVVVECRDGWIEDGPDVALERLRAQLAALAVPR